MASTVGFVDSAVGAVAASVTPKAEPVSLTVATTAGAGATPGTAALLHTPRVVLDPTAGFITEYLSSNGSQVVSQTPNAITVAYLRQGLTADGSPKAGVVKATA